jgi:hypothetical protein
MELLMSMKQLKTRSGIITFQAILRLDVPVHTTTITNGRRDEIKSTKGHASRVTTHKGRKTKDEVLEGGFILSSEMTDIGHFGSFESNAFFQVHELC